MADEVIGDDRIAAVCRVLLDQHVEFVVIGGVAAKLHDTGYATVDIDICPSSADENAERLAAALRELGARLRVEGEPRGVPVDLHPQQLHQMSMLTLITVHGHVDLYTSPASLAWRRLGFARRSPSLYDFATSSAPTPATLRPA